MFYSLSRRAPPSSLLYLYFAYFYGATAAGANASQSTANLTRPGHLRIELGFARQRGELNPLEIVPSEQMLAAISCLRTNLEKVTDDDDDDDQPAKLAS